MKFDDLIETIDLLANEEIDQVVDWQLTESPAAKAEGAEHFVEAIRPRPPTRRRPNPLERTQRLISEALAELFLDL